MFYSFYKDAKAQLMDVWVGVDFLFPMCSSYVPNSTSLFPICPKFSSCNLYEWPTLGLTCIYVWSEYFYVATFFYDGSLKETHSHFKIELGRHHPTINMN
jgi:hypothetical protein